MTAVQDVARWHIGKEVPLALVVAVILQTIFLIVWMTNLSSSVTNLAAAFVEFKGERYTREDARRDRELMEQKFALLIQSNADHMRRTSDLESRTQQIERTYKR